ncbi:MAG: metalloregulator ArsR/SmtB family transcription factor [Elainella sp. Prado103]|jgi:DNA-binding transcriptional ArsR family regulator|nr:metalloregulator ArsR/SmtB family transcription factor [Elainella sp. Prado103]
MRLFYHPDLKDISLAGILYALGDPVRLEIVQRLAEQGELPCAALDCDVPRSTMSHHLRVLRESGVLYCRKEGTQHFNSLRRTDLDRLFPGLLEVILRSGQPSTSSVSHAAPTSWVRSSS